MYLFDDLSDSTLSNCRHQIEMWCDMHGVNMRRQMIVTRQRTSAPNFRYFFDSEEDFMLFWLVWGNLSKRNIIAFIDESRRRWHGWNTDFDIIHFYEAFCQMSTEEATIWHQQVREVVAANQDEFNRFHLKGSE
jgi:hypothetical protein